MNSQEKWNLIVEDYQKLYSEQEAKVQERWEAYCSELFGYKKLLGEIDPQRSLHIGSSDRVIPDIILMIDKIDVFDIELKKYCLPFDDSFEQQLISYMNMIHLSVGMIVCKSIFIFSYDYTKNEVQKVEISITKDNEDGARLIELLEHDTFSPDNIKAFIEQKKTHDKNIKEIASLLTDNYVRDLVVADLKKTYPVAEIEEALHNKKFHVSSVQERVATPIFTPPTQPVHVPPSKDIRAFYAQIIKKWCLEMASKGLIQFDPKYTSNAYGRFTTARMDTLLPPQSNALSGWNNHYFYHYEILNRDGQLKMWIALSNKNAPGNIREAFQHIFNCCASYPAKENWEWKTMWSTKSVSYEFLPNEASVYNLLNQQFEAIMNQEEMLLSKLQK